MTSPIAAVENLTVSFGSFTALEDVTCRFDRGSVVGLIGQNGAGKTTLIHAVIGQLNASRGRVARGHDQIAYCPDTPSFEPYLTAEEVLRQSVSLTSAKTTLSAEESRRTLNLVGLADAAKRRTGGFSRGMKQRLGIAAALVLRPHLLFLDEPTSALDPLGREDVLALIREVAGEITVVISSHILSDVQRVADRLLVLEHGQLMYDGNMSDFLVSRQPDQVRLRPAGSADQLAQSLRQAGVDADVADTNSVVVPERQLASTLKALASFPELLGGIETRQRTLQEAFVDSLYRHERL